MDATGEIWPWGGFHQDGCKKRKYFSHSGKNEALILKGLKYQIGNFI
jgi:hypothetical protein